jgi:hypothetical protein
VLGDSSSLVASNAAEASKATMDEPGLVSVEDLASDGATDGDTICVAR